MKKLLFLFLAITVACSSGDESTTPDNNDPQNNDTTPPVITLIGSANVSVTQGDNYTDEGATATDNIDGDLTSSISVSGSVDTATIGNYILTYSVSDTAGNSASVNRNVSVIENPLLDDDGDGVPNADDQCPDTPQGENVNLEGCSETQIDSDDDGVYDAIDLCPNTLAGESVGQTGCSINQQLFPEDLMLSLNLNNNIDDTAALPHQFIFGGSGGATPQYTTDRLGNYQSALKFTGNVYITTEFYAPSQLNGTWTLTFWAKAVGSFPQNQWILSTGQVTENLGYAVGYQHATGTTNPYFKFGKFGSIDITGLPITSVGDITNWHHYAITNIADSNGAVRLYVDGVDRGGAIPNPQGPPTITNSELIIGKQIGFNEYYNGQLDDINFYSRVLSEEEVNLIFQKDN